MRFTVIWRGHKLWMVELRRMEWRREQVGFAILGVGLLSSAGIRVLKYSVLSYGQIEGRAFDLRGSKLSCQVFGDSEIRR